MNQKEVNEQINKQNLEETNWFHIVYWYQLTQTFMREYSDYIDWKTAKRYQFHMSKDFEREFNINYD